MITESIHGHEVIRLLMETPKGRTRQDLLDEIASRFGSDAHFHTCAAQNMSAEQLVDFLEMRGKFVPVDGAMVVDTAHLCADMLNEGKTQQA